MSSTSNQPDLSPVDFSKLTLSVRPPPDDDEDSVEENYYEDEFAFTKEYEFSIEDPNPPPPVVEKEQDRQDLPPYLRFRHEYTEPLVKILVRTIDRRRIPPGQFYSFMDAFCEEFLQFSMGVFNRNGRIKPSLYKPESLERGTGVWGSEINHGILAYIEVMRVSSKYQRKGLGRWVVEKLLTCDALAHCPFFFTMPGVINTSSPFEPPDPDFESKRNGVVSFWSAVGFRRVAGTYFFGYARNANHPMRSLRAEDDAGERQNLKHFTLHDAFDASVTVING